MKKQIITAAVVALVVAGGAVVALTSGDDTRRAAIGATQEAAASTGYAVSDLSVSEGDEGFTDVKVRITRTGTTTLAGSVKISTRDGSAKAGAQGSGDYQAVASLTVPFAAGATTATATVRVFGDSVKETDETLYALLSAPVGSPVVDGLGELKITNDDRLDTPLGLVVGDAVVSETSGNAQVPVFRNGPSSTSAQVTVNVSSGTARGCVGVTNVCDFTPVNGLVVRFAAGQVVAMVPVTILNDTVIEGYETAEVTLSSPSGATIGDPQGTLTIVSRTTAPTGIEISDAVAVETNSGTQAMTFTITRNGSLDADASVMWTTAYGTATSADIVAVTQASLVKFASGESTKTITVNVVGDTTVEPNETFTVKLSASAGVSVLDGTGLGTIVNND